jgi:hypothetical protein
MAKCFCFHFQGLKNRNAFLFLTYSTHYVASQWLTNHTSFNTFAATTMDAALPPLPLPHCCQASAAAAFAFTFIVVVVTVIVAISVAVAAAAFCWLLIVCAPTIAVAAGVFVAATAACSVSAAAVAVAPATAPKLPPPSCHHQAAPAAAKLPPPLPQRCRCAACHRHAAAKLLPPPPLPNNVSFYAYQPNDMAINAHQVWKKKLVFLKTTSLSRCGLSGWSFCSHQKQTSFLLNLSVLNQNKLGMGTMWVW